MGDYIRTASNQFRLVLGGDGNLTLWAYVGGSNARATWSTGTAGSGATSFEMQMDGNLVLRRADRTPIWVSHTHGQPGNHLRLQQNSDLVIWNTAGRVAWQSGPSHDTLRAHEGLDPGWSLTSTNGDHSLLMQSDGKLALLTKGSERWSTPTQGRPGSSLLLQLDGNLLVLAADRSVLWSAPGTFGHATRLVVQNDGALVAYNGAGAPVWSAISAPPAAAYPYPNAPDCNETTGANCVADAWGFFQGQCTSYVAWRLRSRGVQFDNWFRQPSGSRWGNASSWGAAAARAGIPVDSSPRPGDIAWYSSGHVAYVESVQGDGTVIVSDMNADYHNGYRSSVRVPGGMGRPSGYIHL